MQKTWATRFDLVRSVVHDREAGQHREDRDPVSVLGVCALASLSLLFSLNERFHSGTSLLLQVVVVVAFGELPALGFPVPGDDS